jgi:hypothetical protein
MKVKKAHSLLFMLIVMLISGCQQTNISVDKNPVKSSTPTAHVFETYQVPEKIPQPVDGKGSVVGQLETGNLEELTGIIVYLGDLVIVDETRYGGFLNSAKAPSTLVDITSGKFLFRDIDPGKYSLIIYEVGLGGRAYTDVNGDIVILQVEAGKILEVGRMKYQP